MSLPGRLQRDDLFGDYELVRVSNTGARIQATLSLPRGAMKVRRKVDGEASSRDAKLEESPRWSAQTIRVLHQKVLLRCDAKASTPNRREEQIVR